MKKTIWTLILIIVICGVFFGWHRRSTPVPTPQDQPISNNQTFVSADQNITFTYPSNLSVNQRNNIITLNHQINFVNHPFCDFKGDVGTSSTLVDFHTTIQLLNMTVASSAVSIDPSMATSSNLTDDVLKLNPGFIDTYNTKSYNGYMVTEGVEGCGTITYYLPISNSRTLVIQKDLIGALSHVADTVTKAKILAVPGVISPDQSNTIFDSILQSLQVR
jgi:hypothetical protein